MIVGVNADFETGVANFSHHRRAALADLRARQQRPIHQRFKTIMIDNGGARHFVKKSGTKNAFDRAAGMVGTEAE